MPCAAGSGEECEARPALRTKVPLCLRLPRARNEKLSHKKIVRSFGAATRGPTQKKTHQAQDPSSRSSMSRPECLAADPCTGMRPKRALRGPCAAGGLKFAMHSLTLELPADVRLEEEPCALCRMSSSDVEAFARSLLEIHLRRLRLPVVLSLLLCGNALRDPTGPDPRRRLSGLVRVLGERRTDSLLEERNLLPPFLAVRRSAQEERLRAAADERLVPSLGGLAGRGAAALFSAGVPRADLSR